MTHYRASFLSGAEAEIKNSRRKYTHAWCATVVRDGEPTLYYKGFSSSEKQAHKNAHTETRYHRTRPRNDIHERWKPAKSITVEVVEARVMAAPSIARSA